MPARWPVLLLVLVAAAACGDDGDGAATTTTGTRSTVVVEQLALGDAYVDPTGAVTLTTHRLDRDGDLVVVDAEVCLMAGGPSGIPVEEAAWQLRVVGAEQPVPRSVLDDPPPVARPPWPDRLGLANGECFRGKVPFTVPVDAELSDVVFTQLGRPVAWSLSGA